MTSPTKIGRGGSVTYSTRPVGLTTKLFLEAGDHDTVAIWHIELCCKDDNRVSLDPSDPGKSQLEIDISSAAGALVTVRNDGWSEFTCWTDY